MSVDTQLPSQVLLKNLPVLMRAQSEESSRSSQSNYQSLSKILIEQTPLIRSFLDTIKGKQDEENIEITNNTMTQEWDHHPTIDLDKLMKLVLHYNSDAIQHEPPLSLVQLHELVKDAKIVQRIRNSHHQLNNLSELEKMRLHAEERRYLASVSRNISHLKNPQRVEDTFGDSLKSLGMGVNLVLGLFLTFLGGYYITAYAGFNDSVVRLMAGVLFSLCYIIIEVMLLILYDYKLNKKMSNCPTIRNDRPNSSNILQPRVQSMETTESTGLTQATQAETEMKDIDVNLQEKCTTCWTEQTVVSGNSEEPSPSSTPVEDLLEDSIMDRMEKLNVLRKRR